MGFSLSTDGDQESAVRRELDTSEEGTFSRERRDVVSQLNIPKFDGFGPGARGGQTLAIG